MSEQPNILVVEDNAVTLQTLKLFLSAAQLDVCTASNGRDALIVFRPGAFDLVLLDLMLPDVDGLVVCKEIRSVSDVPIVMLSARSTEDEIVLGLESGASDYVCKPFGSKELLARVRRCLTPIGSICGQTQVERLGAIEVDVQQRMVKVSDQVVKLTKSEFDILLILLRSPGRVFTRGQLIDLALGTGFEGFDRTIDTHIWSLRKKIGEPRGNPKYILSEMGVGYRMSADHES